jgi:acetolactate synthase-1/2/3 large subunit
VAYTAAHALVDALVEQGVTCLFANFGSDHPGVMEALAEARAKGGPTVRVITSPAEMVGMSAAHGYWQASGQAQAVLVHVECGTQSLAGAVHNAAKGDAPMLIFAGASPVTELGELPGSRNEFIHWVQDVHDQRGLVRGYMKYDGELRTGANLKTIVDRAFQFARSEPTGPVYLMAVREVLEAQVAREAVRPRPPLGAGALPAAAVEQIGRALLEARRPLVVTSYLGRDPSAVQPLVDLCRAVGIGVLESAPSALNYPHGDDLHLGSTWNEPRQNPHLAAADVVLVLDSDVPWIPSVSRPASAARIFHIDVDPLKDQAPLGGVPAEGVWRATPREALQQIAAWVAAKGIEAGAKAARTCHYAEANADRRSKLAEAAEAPTDGSVSAEYLLSRLRLLLDDRTLVANEGISNYPVIYDHLAMTRPGSIWASGGGSLGWNGGAALGMKLARPDHTVVAVCGDGCFMFSQPSAVFWMARRYDAPILQIVLNNGGWKSPKLSALAVHPQGHAAQPGGLDTSFEPAPDYVGIAAAAGGAWGQVVERADQVDATLAEALRMVRQERRSAVLDVRLAHH